MKSLFNLADRDEVVHRLAALETDSPRQWGRMSPAQMVRHCMIALETGSGDRPMKQKFLGKILTPFIRSSILGQKPFGRNSPTDPDFVVADERDLAEERTRLLELIRRFAEHGPAVAATQTHAFFGALSGQEWGELMYKHIDHHLRQFGV
jgi:hypothetical protein